MGIKQIVILFEIKIWRIRKMRKKLFIPIVVIVAIVSCFIFFQNKNKAIETIGYEIKDSTYKDVISSIGNIEYDNKVEIKAEVSGTLLESYKEIGDKINTGDLIAKIDNNEALLDYKDTVNKSVLTKAKYDDYMNAYAKNVQSNKDQRLIQEKEIASLKLQQSQLNVKILEAKKLLSEKVIPSKNLDALNEQMALLELNLETAKAKLDSLRSPVLAVQEINASIDAANENKNKMEIELEKYSIKSPIDGIIIEQKIEAGTFVQVGQVIFEIASDKEKYAVVEIDEKYINKISIGREAKISIEAYPDETVKGVVVKISPEVNKDTGTIKVKVKINENKELFLQNMAVKVEFSSESFDNVIVIPGKYLVKGEGGTAVFIKDDKGLALKKEIVVYNKNVNNVMVLKGLNPGDVILNPDKLEEGHKVKVSLYEERESGV